LYGLIWVRVKRGDMALTLHVTLLLAGKHLEAKSAL
jgi:hypothetical protein